MDKELRAAYLEEIGRLARRRRSRLRELGIPRSTYYHWRQRRERQQGQRDGPAAAPRRAWNRLREEERETVLRMAAEDPEASCRVLAVNITDRTAYSVSESTVYRILKEEGQVPDRPLREEPAAAEWRHKTSGPDEIWQSDATHYFIMDWGHYKQVSVLDDYSRRILGWVLKPDETAYSISEAVERAVEEADRLGHLQGGQRPTLLSDNGAGYVAGVLEEYLTAHGIRHIFGKPYHPQTQGKIERFHRRIKEKVCLLVYCSPGELERSLGEAITKYNATPHKALSNVSPDDVYAGRREEILARRREKKRLALEARKRYNISHRTGVQATLKSLFEKGPCV